MRVVKDRKARKELDGLVEHYAHTIELWLRKLGMDADERKAWWMEKAEKSAGELDWQDGLRKRGPIPVDLESETGSGITYRLGKVTWTRPYNIDLDLGHFPFDFPLNNAKVAELAKHGIHIRLLSDGTGFQYETWDKGTPLDVVVSRLLEIGDLLVIEKGDEDAEEEDGQSDFRGEDADSGGLEIAGCST